MQGNVRSWSVSEVLDWLQEVNLAQHIPVFAQNHIQGSSLIQLDQNALKEMGLASVGERLRVLAAIRALQKRMLSNSNGSTGTRLSPSRAHTNYAVLPTNYRMNASSERLTTTAETDHIRYPSPGSSGGAPSPYLVSTYSPSQYSISSARFEREGESPVQRTVMGMQRPIPHSTPVLIPAYRRPSTATGVLTEPWHQTQSPTSPTSPVSTRARRPATASSSGSQSTGYAVGRGAFAPTSSAKSKMQISAPYNLRRAELDSDTENVRQSDKAISPALRTHKRAFVKFFAMDGTSRVVDVSECANAHEILVRVIRKFNPPQSDTHRDAANYMDPYAFAMISADRKLKILSESELLAVCNMPQAYAPVWQHGLYLIDCTSTQADLNSFSKSNGVIRRASLQCIMQDLGVESLQQDTSTTASPSRSNFARRAARPAVAAAVAATEPLKPTTKVRRRVRNFFGQRPPSELISSHLADYFPATDSRELQRHSRASLERRDPKARLSNLDKELPSTNDDGALNRAYPPQLSPLASRRPQGSDNGPHADHSIKEVSSALQASHPSLPDPQSQGAGVHRNDNRSASATYDTKTGVSLDESPSRQDSAIANVSDAEITPTPQAPKSWSSLESDTNNKYAPADSMPQSSSSLANKRKDAESASMITMDEITQDLDLRVASRANSPVGQKHDQESEAQDLTVIVDQDGVPIPLLNTHSHKDSAAASITSASTSSPQQAVTPTFADLPVRSDGEKHDLGENVVNVDGMITSTDAEKPRIRWHKGALIGAGSFGKVFLGMNAKTGLLMAVKQVELPNGDEATTLRRKKMIQSLEDEIALLKTIQHPNIVHYLDSYADGEFLNIFLEYVPGGSVVALLRNYGAFEEQLVQNFVRQILHGLAFLHAQGIVHRDIKGANILVDNKGGVKISDFGISKKVESGLLVESHGKRGMLQGSVFWMAPEVVKQTCHTLKADIWSLGCLVVEMLTAVHPWPKLDQMQALFQIGKCRHPEIPPDISPAATDFLNQTFVVDQASRCSAKALLDHEFITQSVPDGVPAE
ncbi:mitogen-activated protein kinase kinase kinase [Malassezia psittaci]|uniref:Mitogen-activated protein kinase kinase kinase n=1 Tax=Malassezia psittaci TaxID=1821823 RepID=A0AAF0JG48_9BASI|nr:mitogen-activated protein kinase kinase kinase [Malassezia psittaci]